MNSNLMLRFGCLALGFLLMGLHSLTAQTPDARPADQFNESFQKSKRSFQSGEVSKSIQLLKECVQLTEQLKPVPAKRFRLLTLNLLSAVYAADGRNNNAEQALEQRLELKLGPNPDAVILQKCKAKFKQQRRDLGVNAKAGSRYFRLLADVSFEVDAKKYPNEKIVKLLSTVENVFGKQSQLESELWFALGQHQFQSERFAAARESFKKCAEIREQLYGKDHMETAIARVHGGKCSLRLQEVDKAAFIIQLADKLSPAYAKYDAGYAYIQMTTGRMMSIRGTPKEGVAYFNRGLEAYETTQPLSPGKAMCHSSLARVMTHLGNPTEVMKQAKLGLSILEQNTYHPLEAFSFWEAKGENTSAWGDAYLIKRQPEAIKTAIKYYREYDALLEKKVYQSRYNLAKAHSLQQIAMALMDLRKFDEARPTISEATRRYVLATKSETQTFGRYMPFYLLVAAQIELGSEHPEVALPILERANMLMENGEWGDQIVASAIRRLLGYAYVMIGKGDQAAKNFDQALDKLRSENEGPINSLSVQDLTEFNKRYSSVLTQYHRVIDSNDQESIAKFYRQIFLAKGTISRVLNAQNARLRDLKGDSRSDAEASYARLSQSVVSYLEGTSKDQKLINQVAFEIRRQREEGSLNKPRQNKVFPNPSDLAPILGNEIALVDLYKLGEVTKDLKAFYIAMVLTVDDDQLNISMVNLGKGSVIDRKIEDMLGGFGANFGRDLEVKKKNKTASEQAQTALSREVWSKKLKPSLKGRKKVIVCPEGRFQWLPWTALKEESGSFVLEDYQIILATDSQSVCNYAKSAPKRNNQRLALLGGLEYGPIGEAKRSICRRWAPLKYSQKEVDEIGRILPRTITPAKATEVDETTFRNLIGDANVLHFATHGFTFTDLYESKSKSDDREQLAARFPFCTSGLVLSNANQRQNAETDDGLLSGIELMHMDLEHVDLVVLSACHSGSGIPTNGEGVFGIQKALHIAGAKSTIASRWSVDDKNTAKLMARFYRNYYANPDQGKASALLKTQREMLAEGMSVSDWASWSLTGDWR